MAGTPQHATLVAATVATMTFDSDFGEVEVTAVDGAAAVYFRFDGVAPVAAATGTYVLPAVAGYTKTIKPKTSGPTVVKFISTGTPKVSARGIAS